MSLFFKTTGESAVSFLSMLHCGLVITGLALASAAFAAGGGGGGSATDASRAMGGDSGPGGGAHKMNRGRTSQPARLEWSGTPSIVSVS
jgi:hypothetical protein